MKCKYCKLCQHTGMFGDNQVYKCNHPDADVGAFLPTELLSVGASRFVKLNQRDSPSWCPVKKEDDFNTPWPYIVCDIDNQPLDGPEVCLRADKITHERVMRALTSHDYIRMDVTQASNKYEIRLHENGDIAVLRRTGITPVFILKRKGDCL